MLWGLFPFALVLVTALISVALGVQDPSLLVVTFGGTLAVGLLFLIWPNRRLGIGRRRAVLLVILGLMVSAPMAYMASLTPQQRAELEVRTEERETAAREDAAREVVAREDARREVAAAAQREAEAAPPPSQQEPEQPGPPSTEARASFLQTHTAFMGLANRCDSAWGIMTDAAGTNDTYAAYGAARRGAEICGGVSYRLGRLEFSSLIEPDTRRALNRAVDECSLAMFLRKTSMDQAARIFDGNIRPSAVEEFRQEARRAQQQTIQCMVQYLGAATDGGYEVPSLESDGGVTTRE